MDWFFMEGERRVGPVPEQHLRDSLERGGLPHDSLVWHAGMEGWQPASEVLDLAPAEPDAWFYRAAGGGTVGPVSAAEVAGHVLSGELGPDAMVCHVGDTVWEPISADRDLLDAIAELRHERKRHPVPRPQRPAPAEPVVEVVAPAAAPANPGPSVPSGGDAVWYQRALGGEKGPFTLAQLAYRVKQGALTRDDAVRGPDHDDWTRAADLPELAKAFNP